LNLLPIAEKSTAEISDGQLQQAMIARALAQCAHFLLLDEPTTYLDYIAKEELLLTMKTLAKTTGIGILFTSHDLEIIRSYADNSYELAEGRLLQLPTSRG
jgi:iron complex transport system ATP-binding protein